MAYAQACKLLKNPDCNLLQLLDALEALAGERAYIVTTITWGLRVEEDKEDPENDLVRIIVLILKIKRRIIEMKTQN